MRYDDSRASVTAVLGPTNTGKTYLAVDRMLGHASGMIGFPLRLLARENYDRVCRLRGAGVAALITGEERIVPANPRYFFCTVEAMPLDRRVDFLAIDEIQLCADPERGHIFTDRLLRARGEAETMFLGAETMAPIIRRLVPEARFLRRPRFSRLTHAGRRKLARLPPRSAVVAFSAGDVYAIAELLRRQRGGAAIVMGALSPRTRNAQVAMYEAGEVDYLVATDAIGMGLNMGIDHVAFASVVKFDGQAPRRLTPSEIAQIAGRAGRHMNDGTFGVTAQVRDLDPEIVLAVEEHRFAPITAVRWRNPALDFRALGRLKRSLELAPPGQGLRRARDAEDYLTLTCLMRDGEIAEMATTPEAIRLLWDVCRTPNFANAMADSHAAMLGRVFRFLMSPAGVVPADYVARALARLDRSDGDVDTLVSRIAHTRTWTYVSHRRAWLADAAHWQERARVLEDKLSDALHDRLTQRFVDRHATAIVRRLRARGSRLAGAIALDGTVLVEGHAVGRMAGLSFLPEDLGPDDDGALLATARRVVRDNIDERVATLERATDDAFRLDGAGRVCWQEAVVARLSPGKDWLRPNVDVVSSASLEPHQRERVRRRLASWLAGLVRDELAPLVSLSESALSGPARGLAYQLAQGGGSVARRAADAQVRSLSRVDRSDLARLGVRLGVESAFMPAMLKPGAVELRAQLWSAHAGAAPASGVPDGRRPATPVDGIDPDLCAHLGYRIVDSTAIRVDILERLLARLRSLARSGVFTVPPELEAMLGVGRPAFVAVLERLGYVTSIEADGIRARRRSRRRLRRPVKPATGPADQQVGDETLEHSPFAPLAGLGEVS